MMKSALAWILAGVLTILVDPVAAAFSSRPYSFVEQAISDLGVTGCGPVEAYGGDTVEVCSPAYLLVDGGWVLAGILTAVAVWFLRAPLGLGRWTTVLVAASGVLLAGVGAFPADVNLAVHAVFGGLGFVVQNLALLAAGLGHRSHPARRALAGWEIAGGVLGLVATGLLFVPGLADWFGLVERIAAYPFPVWLICAGLVVAIRARRGEPRPAS